MKQLKMVTAKELQTVLKKYWKKLELRNTQWLFINHLVSKKL